MADKEKQAVEQEDAVKDTEQCQCECEKACECEKEESCSEAGTAEETASEEACEETVEGDGEEAQECGTEGEEPKSWSEKKAARKHAKQDKKTEEYKLKIAELEDKSKRQLAEFENFRKRTEKEKQAMFETGAKSVVEKILPVIDNFERGFATVDPADAEDAFVKGMSQVYKQMMTELDKIGVKPIEAVGQEFDPNLHNAVMQVQSEEYEAGIVAQELQKGYTYRDSVVRYSMVAVVNE